MVATGSGRPFARPEVALAHRITEATGDVWWTQILINLVAGALGGVGAGKRQRIRSRNNWKHRCGSRRRWRTWSDREFDLPSIFAAAQSGNLGSGWRRNISQAIAGGAGGAIATAMSAGTIKNKT